MNPIRSARVSPIPSDLRGTEHKLGEGQVEESAIWARVQSFLPPFAGA